MLQLTVSFDTCFVQGPLAYMIFIFEMLWNARWAYDLIKSVKNPMIYTERNHKRHRLLVYGVGLVLAALTLVVGRFGTSHGFCTLNNGKIHAFLVSVPFLLVVLFSAYVHCKYGSQAYLKLFSKNYIRF